MDFGFLIHVLDCLKENYREIAGNYTDVGASDFWQSLDIFVELVKNVQEGGNNER